MKRLGIRKLFVLQVAGFLLALVLLLSLSLPVGRDNRPPPAETEFFAGAPLHESRKSEGKQECSLEAPSISPAGTSRLLNCKIEDEKDDEENKDESPEAWSAVKGDLPAPPRDSREIPSRIDALSSELESLRTSPSASERERAALFLASHGPRTPDDARRSRPRAPGPAE